jgi:hypothetical protein
MDHAQNKAAKDSKGNLNSTGLPPNAEANDVTKIKTSDQRKPTKKADLDAQKRRLEDQGRSDKT